MPWFLMLVTRHGRSRIVMARLDRAITPNITLLMLMARSSRAMTD
jgi:hypothetical protein